nr:hypothetical protein [uncultured Ruminococcus sp.]
MGSNWKKFLQISLWLTVILFIIRLIISWSDIALLLSHHSYWEFTYSLFGFIGEAIGVSTILMAIFNKWIWKASAIRWIHNCPVLCKRYRGTFISDYDQQKRDGQIIVKQTFLSVSVRFVSGESSSKSITASFEHTDTFPSLVYTYINEPKGNIQERSPIHYGTVVFDVSDPNHISGNYYTDRKTKGHMDFLADNTNT